MPTATGTPYIYTQTGGTPYLYMYVQDMSGGLNIHDSPFAIQDNQLTEAMNITIHPQGIIQKRDGYAEVTDHTISGVSLITNIFRFYSSSNPMTFASANVGTVTKIYNYKTNAWVEITGGSDIPAGRVWFKEYKHVCFIYSKNCFQYTIDGITKHDVVFKSVNTALQDYYPTRKDIRHMEICDDRIFLVFEGLPNSVFFTEYGGYNSLTPEGLLIPVENYFNIKEQCNDQRGITGLRSYSTQDELLIGRENDLWILLGVGSTDYTLRKLSGQLGNVSYDGMCEIDDGRVVIVGNGKIGLLDGGYVYSVGDDIQPRLEYTSMRDCITAYDPKRNLVYITSPTGCWIWNIKRSDGGAQPITAWTEFDIPMDNVIRYSSSYDNNEMYITLIGSTKLYKLGGDTDNGSDITMAFTTKIFDLNTFAEKKLIRGIKSLQDTNTEYPFTVEIFMDGNRTNYSQVMKLPVWGSMWDAVLWDKFIWSDTNSKNGSMVFNPKIEQKDNNFFEIAIRVSVTDSNPLSVYKLAMELVGRSRDRSDEGV